MGVKKCMISYLTGSRMPLIYLHNMLCTGMQYMMSSKCTCILYDARCKSRVFVNVCFHGISVDTINAGLPR